MTPIAATDRRDLKFKVQGSKFRKPRTLARLVWSTDHYQPAGNCPNGQDKGDKGASQTGGKCGTGETRGKRDMRGKGVSEIGGKGETGEGSRFEVFGTSNAEL